jgi:hypothetical protein
MIQAFFRLGANINDVRKISFVAIGIVVDQARAFASDIHRSRASTIEVIGISAAFGEQEIAKINQREFAAFGRTAAAIDISGQEEIMVGTGIADGRARVRTGGLSAADRARRGHRNDSIFNESGSKAPVLPATAAGARDRADRRGRFREGPGRRIGIDGEIGEGVIRSLIAGIGDAIGDDITIGATAPIARIAIDRGQNRIATVIDAAHLGRHRRGDVGAIGAVLSPDVAADVTSISQFSFNEVIGDRFARKHGIAAGRIGHARRSIRGNTTAGSRA